MSIWLARYPHTVWILYVIIIDTHNSLAAPQTETVRIQTDTHIYHCHCGQGVCVYVCVRYIGHAERSADV